MNARFKVAGQYGRFIEERNDVTLTLRQGQSLSWSEGGPTDEGWNYISTTVSLEGGELTMEYCNDGSDCDGRLTRHGTLTARLEELRDGFPQWQEQDASQRDYAAEAAGY